MIKGVTIVFGLAAFILIAIVSAWLILLAFHLLAKKHHEIRDHFESRRHLNPPTERRDP